MVARTRRSRGPFRLTYGDSEKWIETSGALLTDGIPSPLEGYAFNPFAVEGQWPELLMHQAEEKLPGGAALGEWVVSEGVDMTSPPAPPAPRKRLPTWVTVVVAVAVAVAVVVAGISIYYVAHPTSSPTKTFTTGGFTEGQPVTFFYPSVTSTPANGSWVCTPGLTAFFPSETNASRSTSCEAGAANQTAVPGQLPQWVLVPAFAGLSVFGVTALGASAQGFPEFNGTTIPADCGGGGSPTACADHPTYLYSPLFADVENFLNLTTGYGGLPLGVLPTPSHDHLLNTSTTYPNIPWGSIVVLVLDPNIFPNRTTGDCTQVVASNLSNPTGNCLNSIAALDRALSTYSSAVANANGGANNNPIWKTFGGPTLQVIVPGDLTIPQINELNMNFYDWFAVSPGAPSSFPS